MKFTRIFLILALLSIGGFTIYRVLSPQNTNPPAPDATATVDKPIVIATLFPFYDVAKQLLQEQAEISLLLPPGIEPHTFEPTPQDIIKIQNADIFIYTGDIMEPWVSKIIADIPSSVKIIDASKDIQLIKSTDDHSHDDHDDEDKPSKIGSDLDPHFWLDFDNLIISTNTIANTISSLNLIETPLLEENKAKIIKDLSQLNIDYRDTLALCKNKTILQAGHRTFEYLARKYNLKYITTDELSPNSETSAKNIANLIQEVRKTKAKAIFSEELIEPRIANTISDETGVPVLQLNGAHNISSDQFKSGISFIEIMKQNLDNLSIGLDCK